MPGACMICWAMFGNGAPIGMTRNTTPRRRRAVDPPGPSGASYRVFRGGSWYNNARCCRPAYRSRSAPVFRDSDLGFRVAAVQE